MQLSHVAQAPRRALRRQWVALSDAARPEAGVTGFVLLSVQVRPTPTIHVVTANYSWYILTDVPTALGDQLVGPGDTLAPFDDEEEEGASDCAVSLPPSVRLGSRFLALGIMRAEHLPSMDSTFFDREGAPDAFVSVAFKGRQCRTPVIKDDRNPEWGKELWLPFIAPSCGTRSALASYIERPPVPERAQRLPHIGCPA